MINKPRLEFMGKIAPIIDQRYTRYLPTAFDESLTLIEKINKMNITLNQVGDLTNLIVDQWSDVAEWLLGEGLTSSIRIELGNMRESGLLSEIINTELLGSRSRIVVSPTEPLNSDSQTFWYKEVI